MSVRERSGESVLERVRGEENDESGEEEARCRRTKPRSISWRNDAVA